MHEGDEGPGLSCYLNDTPARRSAIAFSHCYYYYTDRTVLTTTASHKNDLTGYGTRSHYMAHQKLEFECWDLLFFRMFKEVDFNAGDATHRPPSTMY